MLLPATAAIAVAPAGAVAKKVIPAVTVGGTAALDANAAATPGKVTGGIYTNTSGAGPSTTAGYGDVVYYDISGTHLDAVNTKYGAVTAVADSNSPIGALGIASFVPNVAGTSAVVGVSIPNITLPLALYSTPYPDFGTDNLTGVKIKVQPDSKGKFTGGGNATVGSLALSSNCGPLDAVQAGPGLSLNGYTNLPYAVPGDFGTGAKQQPTSIQDLLTSDATTFVQVYVQDLTSLGLHFPSNTVLCAADLGLGKTGIDPTAGGFEWNGYGAWGTNYGLHMTEAGSVDQPILNSKKVVVGSTPLLSHMAFQMPFASTTTVTITANNTQYKVANADKANFTGCQATKPTSDWGVANPNFVADAKKTTCTYDSSTGVMTVIDAAKHTESQGTILYSPAVDLIAASPSVRTAHIKIQNTTATITLGKIKGINIGFNPAGDDVGQIVFSHA